VFDMIMKSLDNKEKEKKKNDEETYASSQPLESQVQQEKDIASEIQEEITKKEQVEDAKEGDKQSNIKVEIRLVDHPVAKKEPVKELSVAEMIEQSLMERKEKNDKAEAKTESKNKTAPQSLT